MKFILTAALLLVTAPAFAEEAPIPPLPPEVVLQAPQLSFIPSKTPHPGSEQALRRQIEAIEAGQPDYDAMTPNTAKLLRGQFSEIRPAPARQWGALISMKLRHSTPREDVYEARFEKARVQWVIALDRRGKVTGLAFKTLS